MHLEYSKLARLGMISLSLIIMHKLYAHELEGLWIQPCAAQFQRIESIAGNQVKLTETSYSDPLCTNEQLSIINSGLIFFGEAPQIDFTFSQVEIELKTSSALTYFNNQAMCGLSDWKINTPKTITGLRCDLFNSGHPVQIPSFGEKRFGIYKLEELNEIGEKRLYFGQLTQEKDARTEARRPILFDPRYYIKMNSIIQSGSHLRGSNEQPFYWDIGKQQER